MWNTSFFLKAVSIIKNLGACRCCELVTLKTTNVKVYNDMLLVTLIITKGKIRKRSFTVTNANDPNGLNYYDTVRKYMELRLANYAGDRFFLGYQNGKSINQPIGKNTISAMPMKIAEFLGLWNPKEYTGKYVIKLNNDEVTVVLDNDHFNFFVLICRPLLSTNSSYSRSRSTKCYFTRY